MFWRLCMHEWRQRWREVTALGELAGLCVSLVVVWGLLADAQMQLTTSLPVAAWVTLLFATVLYAGRSFDPEWAPDGSRVLEGWQQLPQWLPYILALKWGMNCLFLWGALVGVWSALALLGGTSIGACWPLLPIGCGVAGLAAPATLLAGLLCAEQRRTAILVLVCYPVAIPLLLAVSQCLVAHATQTGTEAVWFRIAAGTSLLYIALSYGVAMFALGREG